MFDFEGKILDFFESSFRSIFDSIFIFLSDIVFSHDKMPNFFIDLYGVFLVIGSAVMLVLVSFKVVQAMIQNAASGGSNQIALSDIVVRTLLASAMIPIMPFILLFIVGKVVYPLGEYMFKSMGESSAKGVVDVLRASELGEFLGSQIMLIIVLGIITIGVTVFTVKMCIYHADLILLQVLSVWAAISIIADDNNYASVWWREVLSQVTTIVVQVAIMAGMVQLLSNDITWWSFMLIIGFSVLLIRGPSVTRHMWYATGSGKAAIGQAGKIATRISMLRGVTR
ncbi:conjugal transfer protein TrbL family protein [Jeotgalibacillus soli]|uniref:Uncharacterized protein n=1 Tax=Jeotgalibacillus soli TaxID=889306 RepID=A0A0C2RTV1_9BACL|nr:conjugal transfer protein TrbL family protein [Jeotgalibacillus soli]KIL45169.1 hypothetical protein KP78_27130 [Jeotgalibacillus soli]